MDFHSKDKHIVDILFVIALFCVFAVSALMLVLIGSNVYRKTVQNMDKNYNTRTSLAYISEKIRQFDETDSIEIGSLDDTNALILKTTTDSGVYNTYIYMYQGYLKELFAAPDAALTPESGQNILPIHDFVLTKINGKLYRFTLSIDKDQQYTLYVSTHSQP
ncbi:MAG: DUF4860 domain-containing protein [Lachnospiraceae bacterium]|nr:DUF4860 domain-containing protein [Lachnospiraceae bacterium]